LQGRIGKGLIYLQPQRNPRALGRAGCGGTQFALYRTVHRKRIMDDKAGQRYLGRLSLETGLGVSLGDTRIRLLEEIERKGSINQAARAVPLSYKAAWDAIDAMNNLSPHPLVVRSTGGRQ